MHNQNLRGRVGLPAVQSSRICISRSGTGDASSIPSLSALSRDRAAAALRCGSLPPQKHWSIARERCSTKASPVPPSPCSRSRLAKRGMFRSPPRRRSWWLSCARSGSRPAMHSGCRSAGLMMPSSPTTRRSRSNAIRPKPWCSPARGGRLPAGLLALIGRAIASAVTERCAGKLLRNPALTALAYQLSLNRQAHIVVGIDHLSAPSANQTDSRTCVSANGDSGYGASPASDMLAHG